MLFAISKDLLCASAKEGVEANYENDVTDEFVEPFIVEGQNEGVQDGDAVIFFNFRPDRAAQLSEIFTNKAFDGFKVERVNDLFYATFTKYNDNVDAEVVFEKVDLTNTIGEVAQNNNLKQLRIAETENTHMLLISWRVVDVMKNLKVNVVA